MCNLSEALIEETREGAIKFLIGDYLEDGKSRDQIIQKIMKGFNLDEETAASYFDKYKS